MRNITISKVILRNQIDLLSQDIFDARDQVILFFEKDDEEFIELAKSNLESALKKIANLKSALGLY